MHGGTNVAAVDDLVFLDLVAHHVQPLGVVHDLFRYQKLAIHETAEFSEDLPDPFAEFRRLQQIATYLLVIAKRCTAVHQRIEIAVGQSLRLGRDVGLVEVAQEHGRQAFQVADARTVIVPGGAGRLVGLVEVADVHLVHQPQQRRRVARDVAALAAGLVVPELRRRHLLVPAVQRLDRDRLVLVGDAVHDDLAVFLELPHGVAHVLDAILVGQHRALVDDLVDPDRRDVRFLLREVRIFPLGAVAGESLPAVTLNCGHSCLLASISSHRPGRRASPRSHHVSHP